MRVHKRLVVLVAVGLLLLPLLRHTIFLTRDLPPNRIKEAQVVSKAFEQQQIFVNSKPTIMSDNRFSSAVRFPDDPRNRDSSTSTAAATKSPYWAGTNDDGAKNQPAESPARDSGYAYNFVANPYAETHDVPSIHAGPNPHYITEEEVKHLDFPGVREACWARWGAHKHAQPREPLLAPGDISNDRQLPAAAEAGPSSSSLIRKVSKHVILDLDNVVERAKAAKRSLSKKGKGKGRGRKGKDSGAPLTISAPVSGSLQPQGPKPLFPEDGSRPLEVVPVAEAQENRLKYGRPTYELAGISAAIVAARASAVAAAEKMAFPSSPVSSSPPPPHVPPEDLSKEHKVPRKAVPASSPAQPQPSRQNQAPPTPTPSVSRRNPLRVVNTASTETVWADFVDAGKDASWTQEPQYQNGGEGPVEQGGRTPSRIAREARVLDFLEGGRLPESPQ